MSFAAPGYLAAALAVAAAVAALHLLVLRPPPAVALPTARFAPDTPAMVRRRAPWPRDRALLALRIATIVLAGLAFARPTFAARRTPFTRIVAVDRSAPAARDSATRYLRPTDVLIAFDTSARIVPADSLPRLGASQAPGSLSAALVTARRAAAQLHADSLALIVISPFATASLDAATAALRAQWPAEIRAVRVAPAPAAPVRPVTVHWTQPTGPVDTIGAVITDGLVAVAPFTRSRTDTHTGEGGLWGGTPHSVIARWVDGKPAAIEVDCVRDIAIGLPSPASREVARLRALLTDRPCGAPPSSAPLSDSAVHAFAGAGPLGASFASPAQRGDRLLMTTLLVLACAAALAELVVRR